MTTTITITENNGRYSCMAKTSMAHISLDLEEHELTEHVQLIVQKVQELTRTEAEKVLAEKDAIIEKKEQEVVRADHLMQTARTLVEQTATDAQLLEVADIFDEYEVGMHMYVGKVFSYEGALYKSRQEHTAQEDWIPGTEGTLSIYHRIQSPPEEGEILPWVPGEELKKGYIRYYEPNGLNYEVLQDHTSQADWLPPDLPSLYKAL